MRPAEQPRPGAGNVAVRIAIGALLVAGAYLIGGDLGASDFDADEYNAMKLVHNDFTEYVNAFHFSKVLSAQFWICDRIFDGSLVGYRLPGALFGIGNLCLVTFLVLRMWPQHYAAVLCTALLLAFNHQAITFSRWGMATYAQYLFLGSWLYFFFVGRVQQPRGPGVSGVILAVAMPWIHFGLMIPFAFGMGLIAVFELFDGGKLRLRNLPKSIWRYKLLGVSIPSFLTAYKVLEPQNWYSALPYLIPYDFAKSPYSKDLAGAIAFGRDNGLELFKGLAETAGLFSEPQRPDGFVWTFAIGCCLVASFWALRQRGTDRVRLFTVFYILGVATAIYALCLAGLYRYGTPRYALFLITPVVVLAGVGFGDAVRLLGRVLAHVIPGPGGGYPAARFTRLTPVFLVLAVLLAMGLIGRMKAVHEMRVHERAVNDTALDFLDVKMGGDPRPFLLVDGQSIYWFRIKWPQWEARGEWMGYQDKRYPDRLRRTPSEFLRVATSDEAHPLAEIVTVTSREFTVANYPEFAGLLAANGYEPTTAANVPKRVWVTSLKRSQIGERTPLPSRMGLSECRLDERGHLVVRGWALSQSSIRTINVYANTVLVGTADYPMLRPDIANAYPEYHDRAAGFLLVSDTPLKREGDAATIVRIECLVETPAGSMVVAEFTRAIP